MCCEHLWYFFRIFWHVQIWILQVGIMVSLKDWYHLKLSHTNTSTPWPQRHLASPPRGTLQCHSEKFLHWFPHGPDASLHKMLLAYTNTGKDNMLISTLKCYQLAKFKFKHVKKFWKKSCMFTTHMSTTPKKVSSKFKIETKKDKFRCE